jgi:hypothetical protein
MTLSQCSPRLTVDNREPEFDPLEDGCGVHLHPHRVRYLHSGPTGQPMSFPSHPQAPHSRRALLASLGTSTLLPTRIVPPALVITPLGTGTLLLIHIMPLAIALAPLSYFPALVNSTRQ